MTCDTIFHVESEGIFDTLHNFQGNNMCDDTSHNQGLIIDSRHKPSLDHIMVESQQSTMSKPEDINKNITKETINMRQDQEGMIETYQKKNKRMMVRSNIPSQKANIIKGQLTPTEDKMLSKKVKRNGMKKWISITKTFKARVVPDIQTNPWSEEEDQILVEVHKIVGNNWTEIAKRLSDRSEDIVKNHWNATKRRVLLVMNKSVNALPPRNTTLENYIRSITIDNDLLKNKEADNNSDEDIVDGVINLNVEASSQTAPTVMDVFTSSF